MQKCMKFHILSGVGKVNSIRLSMWPVEKSDVFKGNGIWSMDSKKFDSCSKRRELDVSAKGLHHMDWIQFHNSTWFENLQILLWTKLTWTLGCFRGLALTWEGHLRGLSWWAPQTSILTQPLTLCFLAIPAAVVVSHFGEILSSFSGPFWTVLRNPLLFLFSTAKSFVPRGCSVAWDCDKLSLSISFLAGRWCIYCCWASCINTWTWLVSEAAIVAASWCSSPCLLTKLFLSRIELLSSICPSLFVFEISISMPLSKTSISILPVRPCTPSFHDCKPLVIAALPSNPNLPPSTNSPPSILTPPPQAHCSPTNKPS